MNLLITGPPRSGKSTLIERIIERLDRPASGFFTREIREHGRRIGFSIVTLDGQEGVLAHQGIKSRYRVGKYGVNLEDLHRLALPSMTTNEPDRLVIVDEIGKMECFSPRFRDTLIRLLDSENDVLGSISLRGGPFIESIKARPDVEMIEVRPDNRDHLVSLADRFSK